MKKTSIAILSLALVILLSGLLLSACGTAKTPTSTVAPTTGQTVSGPDGKTLMQERCTGCHSADRITSTHKTADQWETTVERMISHGAQLNAEEEQTLIDYLAQTYPQ